MTRTSDARSASEWTVLWAQSRHGAIDLRAADPVSEALRAHWQGQLKWLNSCRVAADVGSGPAVLPLLLRRLAGGQLDSLTWECIDEARLPELDLPAQVLLRDATDFGLAEPSHGPVDAVVSNFGLEYVDRGDVAGACARWLRVGGRLCALVHARDSLIDRASLQTLADLQIAIDQRQIFEQARRVLEAIASLPSDPGRRPQHATAVRDAYNDAVDDLKRRMGERGQPSAVWIDILTALTDLARQASGGDADSAEQRRAALAAAYAAEYRRLRSMHTAALADGDRAELGRALTAAGLDDVDWQVLSCSQGVIGMRLTARRRAS